MQKYLFTWVT